MFFNRDFDVFDDLFSAFGNHMLNTSMGTAYSHTDPINVHQGSDGSKYIVRAVVPGFSEDELHVSVNNQEITISGKKEMSEESGQDLHSSSHVSFQKSVVIPSDGLMDKIEADYKNGILAVTIPKMEVSRLESKTVPIKALGPVQEDSND